jgi:hypothetical protein
MNWRTNNNMESPTLPPSEVRPAREEPDELDKELDACLENCPSTAERETRAAIHKVLQQELLAFRTAFTAELAGIMKAAALEAAEATLKNVKRMQRARSVPFPHHIELNGSEKLEEE